MSCEKNGSRVSHTAGALAGISTTANKLGSVWGNSSARMAQISDKVTENVGPKIAPVSNRALQLINIADQPSAMAIKVLPFIPLGQAIAKSVEIKSTLVGPKQGYEPAVFIALKLNTAIKTAGASASPVVYGSPGSTAAFGIFRTTNVWSALGDLLKSERRLLKILAAAKLASNVMASLAVLTEDLEGSRSVIKQGGPIREVKFCRTKLTKLLNKQDRLLNGVLSRNEGELVTYKKSGQVYVWHRGTTTVQMRDPKTGDHAERVITHLQSIAVPASSYYFDRPLSDQEVADIVTGQSKVRPQQLDGYVGSISAIENLTPVWASTKRALILTRLHWPSSQQSKWALKEQEELTLEDIIAARRANKPTTTTIRDAAEILSDMSVSRQSAGQSTAQSPEPLIIKDIPKSGGASEVAPVLKNTFD